MIFTTLLSRENESRICFFTKIRNSHFVETCNEHLISYLDDCQMGCEVFIGWN